MQAIQTLTPRFGAVALRVNASEGSGRPLATAFVGDYSTQGYADGDLVVISPSNTVHRLLTNNTRVAQFTQNIRTERGFEGPGVGPWGGRIKALARPVFLELRNQFRRGRLPISGTDGASALYERLFEQKRPDNSRSTERILCDALGYDFLALSDTDPRTNNRHVFIDRDGRAFRPDPNRATSTSTEPAPPPEQAGTVQPTS